MSDYHERFRERFGKGKTWTITLDWRDDDKPLVWGSSTKDIKDDILAFIDEVVAEERSKGYADGARLERISSRAALIAHVESLRKGMEGVSFIDDQADRENYNQALDDILSYLREPEFVAEGPGYREESSPTWELGEPDASQGSCPQCGRGICVGCPPDASQGCCKKCLDFTFQEGNMVCVDEDCPCHKKGCCVNCSKRHQNGNFKGYSCWNSTCPCHSPQGDKAEGV